MGKNTGPGRLRRTAMNSASTRMNTSAIRNSFTFRTNARAIPGRSSVNRSPLKKDRLISGQPGEFTTTRVSTEKNTTVLISAIRTALRPSVRACPEKRSIRDPRRSRSSSMGSRSPGPGGCPALTAPPEAGRLRLGDCRVAQRLQPFGLDGVELADYAPLRALADEDHHVCRWCFHHDPVDLSRVQRRDDVIRVVVDVRLLVGLDVIDDVAVARGPDLGAQLVTPQVCEGRRFGDARSLLDHERLLHVVVAVAEVHGLRPNGRVRDLSDEEVEVFGARLVRLVEVDRHPRHLTLSEPELVGHRIGDGALEPLAAVRVTSAVVRVRLPERSWLAGIAAEPRGERGVVGGDGEVPLVHVRSNVLGAGRRGRGRAA